MNGCFMGQGQGTSAIWFTRPCEKLYGLPKARQADIQNPWPLEEGRGGEESPSFVANASRDVKTRTLTRTSYCRLGCTWAALLRYKLD